MDQNQQHFRNASIIVGGFFVMAALFTGEWILIPIAILPPLIFKFVDRSNPPHTQQSFTQQPRRNGGAFDALLTQVQAQMQSKDAPVSVAPVDTTPQDPDAVIRQMTDRIENDSKDDEAYLKRGVAYADKNRWDDALSDFNLALWANPELEKAYIMRGILLVHREDYSGGVREFGRALSSNPTSAEATAWRGFAYYLNGNHDVALTDFQQSDWLQKDNKLAKIGQALVKQALGHRDAVTALTDTMSAGELDRELLRKQYYFSDEILDALDDSAASE